MNALRILNERFLNGKKTVKQSSDVLIKLDEKANARFCILIELLMPIRQFMEGICLLSVHMLSLSTNCYKWIPE